MFLKINLGLLFVAVMGHAVNLTSNITSDTPIVALPTARICIDGSVSEKCEFSSTNESMSSEESNVTVSNEHNADVNLTDDSDTTTVTVINATEEETTTETQTSTEAVTVVESSTPSTDGISLMESPHVFGDVCICDMTMNMCDINCCCDPECSAADRAVFSRCEGRVSAILDPRYCYQRLFIYRNNTEYQVERQHNGMFCIVKDNFQGAFQYFDRKPVTSIQQFKKLHQNVKKFPWALHESTYFKFDSSKSYKAEKVIWKIVGSSLKPFEIPVTFVNMMCQSSQPVLYLVDQTTFCLRNLPQIWDYPDPALSAQYYYQGFRILASPQLVAASSSSLNPEQCGEDVCISIVCYLCYGNSMNANFTECNKTESIDPPSYNQQSMVWKNLVQKVQFVFSHNGTRGILRVEAYFWLSQHELSHHKFYQTFSVKFQWLKNDTKPFYRSGNPGYIVGKPVILGKKVTQITESEDEEGVAKEIIEICDDSNYLLALPKSQGGKCDPHEKSPITFGENHRITCVLQLSLSNFTSDQSCFMLQKYILQLLVGTVVENVTDPKNFNVFAATFGNSAVDVIEEWTQVILENLPVFVAKSSSRVSDSAASCEGILKTSHVTVAFSYVGNFNSPQAKILGVSLRFGYPETVMFDCDSLLCSDIKNDRTRNYQVVSSLTFIDITSPAVAHYAEPPVYDIKLPYDFFYPFVFSTANSLYPQYFSMFILALVSFVKILT